MNINIRNGFSIINEVVWRDFIRPINAEDIRRALFDMAPFKAPEPDDFHVGLYRKAWDVVGTTVIENTTKFLESGIMPKNLNDTLVTLIPKPNIRSLSPSLNPSIFVTGLIKLLLKP